MTRKYFGTDGVRGRVGEAPITPDFVLRLGFAAGVVFKRRASGGKPTVLIGKDTRVSGYMIEAALEAGFTSAGVNVQLTGPVPTAAVAYLTRALRLSAGVVISASHNPYYDNGIKFFSAEGSKLPDAVEYEIEALLEEPLSCAPSETIGRARRIDDAAGRYIEFCKSTFPNAQNLRGIKLVVDCAHGAAYEIAPHVFHELGAEVVTIGAAPDGFNINEGAGATHPEVLQAAVRAHHADLGIALDGDADRLVLCDEDGILVDGDALMALCATRMIRDKSLAKNTLVTTVMSNIGLDRALREAGGKLVRTQVGDRYVVEEMRKNGYNLGGEQSGHVVFLDHATTGDGIVAALRVLAIMAREGRPLSELVRVMTRMPQVLVNTVVGKKVPIEQLPAIARMIAEIERELGDDGRVLVRYSGTETKARVMIEGTDLGKIKQWADDIAEALRTACKVA